MCINLFTNFSEGVCKKWGWNWKPGSFASYLSSDLSYFGILRYCSPYFQSYYAPLKKPKPIGPNAAGSALVGPICCKA